MTNVIRLPQMAWYDPSESEVRLPDGWQVEVNNMAGYNRPALDDDQIRVVIANPLGTPPIRELARGKKEVAIIFDDMTRATRAADIVPHVIAELAEAGIPGAIQPCPPDDPANGASAADRTFRLTLAATHEEPGREILRGFLEDLEADRAEPLEDRPAYRTWAVRSAFRFAFVAFVIALLLALILKYVTRLFE